MYGLPKNLSLAFFHGRTLLQVCFGAHDLILNFDGDVSITVMSSVSCKAPDGTPQRHDDFRKVAPTVLAMLDLMIVSTQGDEAGALTLRFDNGGVLVIHDDSKEYESYTISNGGQIIVV